MRMRKLRAVFSWAAISLLVVASLASAEPYFGLYGGVAFPLHNNVKYRRLRDARRDNHLTVPLEVTRDNRALIRQG